MTEKQRIFFFENGQGSIGLWNLALETPDRKPAEKGVRGYHVLMTEPFHYAFPRENFAMSELAALTAELSARLWRKYNGPIRMLTDPRGFAYLRGLPLIDAYDEVLPILDPRNHGILPTRYWAAGKLQALTRIPAPCALVDMDLMLWEPLELAGETLVCAHIEHLFPNVYPPPDFFRTSGNYRFPPEWDFAEEPLNTAFLYIADQALQDYYAEQAIRFMCAEKETPDYGATCMIFAEQRILAMCAAAKGVEAGLLLNYDRLTAPQRRLTHVWSAKRVIAHDDDLKRIYAALCEEKLRQLRAEQERMMEPWGK